MNIWRLLIVLSLAIGLALAITLASIAEAVMFRSLPVRKPQDIVRLFSASPLHPLGFVSYPDYRDFALRARTVSGVAAQSQVLLAIGAPGARERSEMQLGLAVSANYFDVLGVFPRMGRGFLPAEDRAPVAILSDSFWRRKYAADPAMVGKTIFVAHAPFTVIGVAPPGFGLDAFLHEDFYVPLGVYAAGLIPVSGRPWEDRNRRYLSLYARRTASLAAVRAEMQTIAAQLAREFPATNHDQSALAMTDLAARIAASAGMYSTALILLALAGLSLVAGGANACGLWLMRMEARAGEFALKTALGAGPLRLWLESLREIGLLCTLALTGALPLAWGTLKIARRVWEMPSDLPIALDAHIDARTAAAALACALLIAVVCTTAHSRMRRVSARLASLRHGERSATLSALVVMQVALATVLLGCAAALFSQMTAASHVNLGYRTDHILTLAFDPSQSGADEIRTRAFYRELLDRVSQLKGVRGAALAQSIPLGFTAAQKPVKIAGAPETVSIPGGVSVWMNTVTPGYFELMRMRLIEGRDFDARDSHRSARVVIVNQAFARYWTEGRALGQTVDIDGRKTEVVGVVATAKYQQVGEAPRPFFYLPYEQNFVARLSLHVLTAGAPSLITADVVGVARSIDSALTASEIRPLDEYLSRGALSTVRIGTTITAAASGCAWLLSLTGLYACISRSVARRSREIGIRQALGARRGSIILLILRQGMRLIVIGTGIGLILAAVSQHMITRIGGTPGAAWPGQLAAGISILATSLVACALPAWRASSIHPAVACRRC